MVVWTINITKIGKVCALKKVYILTKKQNFIFIIIDNFVSPQTDQKGRFSSECDDCGWRSNQQRRKTNHLWPAKRCNFTSDHTILPMLWKETLCCSFLNTSYKYTLIMLICSHTAGDKEAGLWYSCHYSRTCAERWHPLSFWQSASV